VTKYGIVWSQKAEVGVISFLYVRTEIPSGCVGAGRAKELSAGVAGPILHAEFYEFSGV